MKTTERIDRIIKCLTDPRTNTRETSQSGDSVHCIGEYEYQQAISDLDILRKLVKSIQKDVSRLNRDRNYQLEKNRQIHKDLKIYEDRMKEHGITG